MEEYVYHYTSADAFVGMFSKEDVNKVDKELIFWASSVYYMNDTSEMTVLYDELIKIMPKIEKALNLTDNLLSEVQSTFVLNNGVTVGDIIKELFYKCIFRNVYVISFSDQRDTLPMWSMYGKNGNGLCLVFDIDKLNSCLDINHKMKKVFYSLEDDEVWNNLKEKYKWYYEKDYNVVDKWKDFISSVLLDLSGKVKDTNYDYEQEYRIIDHVVDMNDLNKWSVNLNTNEAIPSERPAYISEADVRVRNGLMIPYIKFRFPLECLSKVIVGPSINQELQKEGLRILLKETHLKEDDIILSDIPYREL